MEQPIKVLWISLNAPTERSGKAGGNTFNYYFRSFYEDGQFDVKLIAANIDNPPIYQMREGDYFILERKPGLIGKLSRLSSLESIYNPWNRNANLISNQFVRFVKDKIRELLSSEFYPKVVILEWTQCVILANIVHAMLPNAKLIASEHDVTFVGYERKTSYYKGLQKLIWNHRARWEKRIELSSLNKCDLILPHNPDNIDLIVSNGIPKKRCQWLVPFFNDMGKIIRKRGVSTDILYYGAMSRPENYLSALWFANEVLPLLKDINIRFVILGSNPTKELKELESNRVHVTGFVDSVEPYFENSLCLVAPLVLGAGIKVKILEALSSGIPVLTNSIGIEGIPAKNGADYYHCEKPMDYVEVIRDLLSGKLGLSGKEFIANNYSVKNSLKKYKRSVKNLTASSLQQEQ